MRSAVITFRNTMEGVGPDRLDGFFDGWPQPPDARRRLEILNAADHVVLACDRERVVGFVSAVSDGTFSAVLNLLEVRPGYRGQSIGSELVRRVLREIGDLYVIDVACDEEVVPLYQRLGFIPGRA